MENNEKRSPRAKAKLLLKLYLVFAQLGVCTFGGGYAMLALLQRVVAEQYKWTTEEELMDYYAVGQCTPGIIAINTSTFVGYKMAGIPGAIVASLGFLTPSIIIITIIAAFLTHFAENIFVQHALAGIRVCVFVLVLDAIMKLAKKALASKLAWVVYGVILVLSLFTAIPTVVLVLAAGILGYLLYLIPKLHERRNA